ncbi:MBL fold metallo-hydrolase [Halobacteriales archaeon QS_7_69_60]|nr:MAG: MBL fold metallo-hydrolase [Halobacteriales archaeon QS_7_69_60]
MAIGDVVEVEAVPDCYHVDTGMYGTPAYGSVYLLDADRPAIVDSGIGTEYERILDGLEAVGIAPAELEAVLLTHVHLDHAGGAGFIAAETGADVYVHADGADFLSDPGPLWEGTKAAVGDQIRYYTEPESVPADAVESVRDGDAVDLGSTTLDVHHAPGHAFHQVVFEDRAADAVYTADAAGIYVPTFDAVRETTPPPGFDFEEVVADARMIADLDPWVEAIDRKRAELDDEAVVEHFVEAADVGEAWGEKKAAGEVAMNVRGVLRYLDERES